MSARSRFCELALSKLGSVVLWAQRGPDVFDCSGLVAHCLKAVGGVDLRATHNAQMMADETPNLLLVAALPIPGDLVFYGAEWDRVVHVAIWLAGGKILSADGATSRVLDLKTARANPSSRIRLHDTMNFRRDWLGLHRHSFLDDVDKVTR